MFSVDNWILPVMRLPSLCCLPETGFKANLPFNTFFPGGLNRFLELPATAHGD